MPDTFTETSTQGFLSRLTGSLGGLLFGPLLVIGAIVLLSWNEGRAVHASRGLADAATQVVEAPAQKPVPGNEGKLIHVIGTATAQAPIHDSQVGAEFTGQVAVERTVAMYQWSEQKKSSSHDNLGGSKTTTTTYSYSRHWSSAAIDSSEFKHAQDHTNPPMPFASQRFAAAGAKLGAYPLDATTLALIDPRQTLTPSAPDGWKAQAGALYHGDPAAPKIGDLRVTYTGLPSGATLSVLAAQSHGGFAPFVTADGYQVQLAEIGNRPAKVMLADKRSRENLLTWFLRALGAVVMFLGFNMFLSPLETLASVIPLLGRIVGGAAALLALAVSIPLSLVVIALAWLAVRPLIGGALLIAAAAALYGLWRLHRSHRRPTAAPSPTAAA